MSVKGALALGVCTIVVLGVGGVQAQEGGVITKLSAEDYLEIEQLYARYNATIDAGDHAGWASTFTEDGALGNTVGRDALAKTSANWRDNRNGAKMRHWNANLLIKSVTPEGVTAMVYLMVMDHTMLKASQAGIYEDFIVKTPTGWLFKRRTLRSDPRPTQP